MAGPKKMSRASAQVVLRGARGAAPKGDVAITSANVAEFIPSREAVAEVQEAFARLGFAIGTVVGNNFSITGPMSTFERVFGVRLRRPAPDQIVREGVEGPEAFELPLSNIPPAIRRHVTAVTFTPAPEFGPGNFGP